MNINAKQKLVLSVITENPEAANDESLLYALIWEREQFEAKLLVGGLRFALKHVTRPETISRRRRELYNLGLITYTDKALDERTEAFKNEQAAHSEFERAY